jgi:hypothetical protein
MAGAAAGMGGGGAGMGGPIGQPKWSSIFTEIIAGTGCNGGFTCHQGAAAGMLQMTDASATYDALVGKPAMGMNFPGTNPGTTNCKDSGMMRVVAGQPDMSLLVNKIEKVMPACGGPMPPQPLTAAQQQQVRMWIMMGAMKN